MVNPGGRGGSRFSGGRDRRDRDRAGGRRFERSDRKPDRPSTGTPTATKDRDENEVKDSKENLKLKQDVSGTEHNHTMDDDSVSASNGPKGEKKFTGRCRLFVGNLHPDTAESDFVEMFKPYGECSEVFLNAHRAFGFIRMDVKENAEKAKKALDGLSKRGRILRVRFAAHSAAIRVRYLHPFVSNELLHDAFSMFGEIERAVVCIDDKGKPNGEGIVEFARKPGAMQALKRVNEGVFLLGSSPRPVVCELVEHKDEEDGLPEQFLNKNQEYSKEREGPPRFASQGSFEFNFSQKWKELFSQHEQRKKQLQDEFNEAISRLEMDESSALMEHQTALLREDLLRRQEELRRMEEQHQMEIQKRMDQRLGKFPSNSPQQNFYRRQQEDAKRHVDDERRREDEARMFMQQELAMRQMQEEHHMGGGGPGGHGNQHQQGGPPSGNAPPMQPPPAPPVGLAGPGGNRGRNPNEMNMGNRGPGMQQMHPNNMGGMQGTGPGGMQGTGPGGMQGQGPGGNPQQMQNMRGSRKRDSDYRQSRFDQPPQQFQGGNQQMGNQQQQQQQQQQMGNQPQHMGNQPHMGGPGGGMPGNMMFQGQGVPVSMGAGGGQGNMGGGPPVGPPQGNNPGNMGGQGNMGGPGPQGPPGAQMMRGGGGGGGPSGNQMQERNDGGEFIENKRNRRF